MDPLVPEEATEDDPFAELEIETSSAEGFEASGSLPITSLLPEEEPSIGSEEIEISQPMARISLGSAALPTGEYSHVKTAVAGAVLDQDVPPIKLGAWPTLIGALAGLFVALFLFPGLGRDWFDLGDAPALVRLTPERILGESLESVTVRSARVTSYPGSEGRRILVVSGAAHNEGMERLEQVHAVVMMLDGAEVVERRRALVGLALDEAALSRVGGPADLDEMYQAARREVSLEHLELSPGVDKRFVVVFPEVPEQIEKRTFRVEFVKAPIESAKKAPTGPK